MKKKPSFIIEDLGTIDLPEEMDILVTQKIKEAEEDLRETRMQIRWGVSQVNLIKKAAQMMGIPYQTYAKQVLINQALDDIERLKTFIK